MLTLETSYERMGPDKIFYNIHVSGLTKEQRDEAVKLILSIDKEVS